MEEIINYFKTDPLRVLYLLGGSGGLWFWFKEWKNRSRVRIAIVLDYIDDVTNNGEILLRAEIVNLSSSVTSVDAQVVVTAVSLDGKLQRYVFQTHTQERTLPPHVPLVMGFRGQGGQTYPFSWYRRYRFTFTSGLTKSVFIRNHDREHINCAVFALSRLKVLVFRRPLRA